VNHIEFDLMLKAVRGISFAIFLGLLAVSCAIAVHR